jgi:hypothetical protein
MDADAEGAEPVCEPGLVVNDSPDGAIALEAFFRERL